MTGSCRLSIIGIMKLDTVSDASVVQLGDSCCVELNERAIALQRRIPDFYKDETKFAAYRIFSMPLPIWGQAPDAVLTRRNRASDIRVGEIRINAVSASSYIHAGSAVTLSAKSRIKHIRQYNI